MLNLPGLGQFTPRQKTMVSVHFNACHNRPHHSGRRMYTLEAAPRDSYTKIVLYDSQQMYPDLSDAMAPPENRAILPMPVTVESIVAALKSLWTTGGVGAMGMFPPGIDVIEGDEPTAAELTRLRATQERLCRALVEEGDAIKAGNGPKGHRIGITHRKALEWLGSEKRDWFKPIEQGVMKKSAVSGNQIPMEAQYDGTVDLLEHYVKYGFDPLEYGDTFVADMFKKKPEMKRAIERRLGMSQPQEKK